MKKVKKLLLILLAALVLSGAAFGIYTADYYRMDETAAAVCAAPAGPYEIRNGGGRCLVFEPEYANAGLIFYPGGKVEYTAYAPLMALLRERGVLCVLCKMPFNLAVLDGNAAEGIPARFPSVTRWYVGGHSLGGKGTLHRRRQKRPRACDRSSDDCGRPDGERYSRRREQ